MLLFLPNTHPMIIPKYWAEGRIQNRSAGRQITVRRFGWSDSSQAEAQAHAEQRTAEAFQRLLSGEKLDRREAKIPYNGADGLPIREEILDRRGETVVTRNSYGASCLNTPDVFFADIDFAPFHLPGMVTNLKYLSILTGLLVAIAFSKPLGAGIVIGALIFGGPIAKRIGSGIRKSKGDDEKTARDTVSDFIANHPEWNFRVYRTPAGLRLLATHQTFSPNDPVVTECFSALATDPVYSRMCLSQQCFRARVSPKPWRIGITNHLGPRPGVWPVKEEYLPARNAWLADYRLAAEEFSSCRFIESIGSGTTHPDVLPVLAWHDELSKAESGLPIA